MSDVTETEAMTDSFWSCNIDTKGRIIRLTAGLLCLGGAAWCWWGAFGLVAVFEGIRGWCVVRALGGRTPW